MKSGHLKLLILIPLLAIAQVGIAQETDTQPNLQPSEQECLDTVQGAQAELPEVVNTNRGDTYYKFQWYLHGTAYQRYQRRDRLNENSTTSSIHINVEPAWEKGYRGEGTYIAIVDHDIDPKHPDLGPNLVTECSYDYNNENLHIHNPDNESPPGHGVQVSGIAIARGYNGVGIRGVAPLAKFFILSTGGGGSLGSFMNRLTRNRKITAVSNHSYSASPFGRLSNMLFKAIETGLSKGFYGKGTVYVWAAGNQASLDYNTNYNTWANHYSGVTVCSVDYQGKHNDESNQGASLWVCAPSIDAHSRYGIFTTAVGVGANYGGGRYTSLAGGTSSSTPMVSGVVALMRQANPNLSWRDVKLILAASAAHNDPEDSDWQSTSIKYGAFAADPNGRYRFNHKYGFGLVDAYQAVRIAEHWVNLPEQATAAQAHKQINTTATRIESSLLVQSDIDFIEHVEPTIDFKINRWRDLSIELISPAGTTSILAARARRTSINRGYDGAWRFGSSKHLGEAPSGTWRLIARNALGGMITLRNWKLKIRGYQVQLDAVATDHLSDLNKDNELTLSLSGAHWREALTPSDFRLNNAPPGLNISSIEHTSSSQVIKLKLGFTGSLDKAYLFEVAATTATVSNLVGSLTSNAVEIAPINLQKTSLFASILGLSYHLSASELLTSPTTLSYIIELLDETQQSVLEATELAELGFTIEDGAIYGIPKQVGRYHLRVRAMREEGGVIREETFAFNILPPVKIRAKVFLEGFLQ